MENHLSPIVMAAVLAWTPATAHSTPHDVCARGERQAAVERIATRPGMKSPPVCRVRAVRATISRAPVFTLANGQIRGRDLIRAIQKQKPGRLLNLKERSGPACGVPGVQMCYWVLWQQLGRDRKLGPVLELIVDSRTGKILKETKSRRGTS